MQFFKGLGKSQITATSGILHIFRALLWKLSVPLSSASVQRGLTHPASLGPGHFPPAVHY